MKQFHELTEDQQKKAVEFAHKTLKDSLSQGVLELNRPISESEFLDLATDAAESSQYDDNGRAIVEGMEVPYFFDGGCV